MSDCLLLAVNVAATVIGIVFVDKLGRKVLLLFGGFMMIAMEVTVAFLIKDGFAAHAGKLPKHDSINILVCICIYVTGFAFSWGPVGWLYPT